MFSLPIISFITIVFTIIQISVWTMLPEKLRDIMMANPIMAFLINLIGSALIAGFTGIASIVGICNLAASVLFAGYATIYGRRKGIKGLGIRSHRIFKVPIFPKLVVCYQRDGKNWEL